jgi:hypothetical protein
VAAYTTLRQKSELTPVPSKSTTETKSDLHKEMISANNIILDKSTTTTAKTSTTVQNPTPQLSPNLNPAQTPTKSVPSLPSHTLMRSQTETKLTSSTQNRTNTDKVENKTPAKESSFPPRLRTTSQPTLPKSSTSSSSAPPTPIVTRSYALSVGSSPRIVQSPKKKSEEEDTSYRKSLDLLVTHTFNALKNISETSAKK